MEFRTEIRKDRVVDKSISLIQVSGNVDTPNLARLQRVIEGQIEQGKSYLILQCKDLEYISSTGIGLLKNLGSKLQSRGGDLVLVSPTPKVKKMIELVGLHHVVKVYDGLKQAEKALKGKKRIKLFGRSPVPGKGN